MFKAWFLLKYILFSSGLGFLLILAFHSFFFPTVSCFGVSRSPRGVVAELLKGSFQGPLRAPAKVSFKIPLREPSRDSKPYGIP